MILTFVPNYKNKGFQVFFNKFYYIWRITQ